MVTTLAGVGVSAGVATAAAKKLPPLVVGGIFPFTGSKSLLSSWGTHGTAVGIYEVNHNGGVLGHQLVSKYVDDAADSVDALPAFRKLMLNHPSVIIGPFSPTIEAVVNQFQPNDVVDFMVGGLTTLDQNTNKFVWRTSSSDSNESLAMAQYAISHGYKTAALLFDNSANSQGFVPPLIKAFKALGGKVVYDAALTPDASSYNSELLAAFANKPTVVFDSMDTQTAATLFGNAQSLGYMTNTVWIGDDLQSAANGSYAQSFGPTASTNLVAALPATPTTSDGAYNHFLSDYQSVWRTTTILPTTFNEYDSVVIAALAMTMAKSTDPKVWVNDIMKVSNPPGVTCGAYAQCVALLNHGKKINYDGASGNDNFNQYHNVFSGFQMLGFTPSLANKLDGYISPAQLAAVVAKGG
ncbi:MAG: ABC transporter substrate-binding protein [Acidimicrobiaceae bacterium]|jgi:ABC-type branched-subunit amino acid transport system substrate-binding protein|nr:ABC transporter substrate-binding protein [Acidimicrobiaceae bacterium]